MHLFIIIILIIAISTDHHHHAPRQLIRTCLLDMHGFLSWCQASAHLLLRNILLRYLIHPNNYTADAHCGTGNIVKIEIAVACDRDYKINGDGEDEDGSPLCSSKIGHSMIFWHRTSPIRGGKQCLRVRIIPSQPFGLLPNVLQGGEDIFYRKPLSAAFNRH